MLNENARTVLSDKAYAHLAVVDAAGLPHVSPVWVDVDDQGRPWFNTAVGRVKDRYLAEGAPVALSALDPGNPYAHVMVRGHVAARRIEGADDDIDALAKKYMDADSYPFRKPGEQRVTITIEPEQVIPA